MCEDKLNISCSSETNALKNTYDASLVVMKRIVPFIPDSGSNIRESLGTITSEIPRTIAAAVARQDANAKSASFSEALALLGDAMVLISYCRDLHDRQVNSRLCQDLLNIYQEASRELKVMGQDIKKEA